MKNKLLFILFCVVNLFSQVDTTVYYPLHVGNKWEYYTYGNGYYVDEIIGDTVMNNGNKYFVYGESGVDAWRFQRFDGISIVYYFNTADEREYKLFDFELKDKSIWEVPFTWYWGIELTWTDSNNMLGIPLENKRFMTVMIDSTVTPPDTIWGPLIDDYPTIVTRGIGISSYQEGLTELVGAVINGVGYGTLVGVEEENPTLIEDFELYQNYPNPFNPTTIINYTIPIGSNVKLIVYDIKGEEITVLIDKIHSAGNYTVNFDASKFNLASGIYFYTLISDNFIQTNKMVYLR